MSNGNNTESVGRSRVKGGTVQVDEAREKEIQKKVRKKVKERIEDLEGIMRKKYGPPGTP